MFLDDIVQRRHLRVEHQLCDHCELLLFRSELGIRLRFGTLHRSLTCRTQGSYCPATVPLAAPTTSATSVYRTATKDLTESRRVTVAASPVTLLTLASKASPLATPIQHLRPRLRNYHQG